MLANDGIFFFSSTTDKLFNAERKKSLKSASKPATALVFNVEGCDGESEKVAAK